MIETFAPFRLSPVDHDKSSNAHYANARFLLDSHPCRQLYSTALSPTTKYHNAYSTSDNPIRSLRSTNMLCQTKPVAMEASQSRTVLHLSPANNLIYGNTSSPRIIRLRKCILSGHQLNIRHPYIVYSATHKKRAVDIVRSSSSELTMIEPIRRRIKQELLRS